MKFVKTALIGFFAVLVIEIGLVFVVAMLAQSYNWGDFALAVGPIRLLEFRSTGQSYETSAGPGIVLLAVLAGLLNGLGAGLLEGATTRWAGREKAQSR